MKNSSKIIVVSGINLVSGGTLSVFQDCLSAMQPLTAEYKIIALVNNVKLFGDRYRYIQFMEYPYSKKSWFLRCFYEYFYFYHLSRKIKPHFWFSLHDISPNVKADIKAVYCHNPSPFYSVKMSELLLDIKFTLFTLFYSKLYSINIKKNDYVIVQQNWMRDKFKEIYSINNVIVAHPKMEKIAIPNTKVIPKTFIYPTFPRIFKNIEVICEAFKLIDDRDAKVYITIDGTENSYARGIVKEYSSIPSIAFIGRQERNVIFEYYSSVEALLFPSKLETWGMPLSEFALTGKPIFASDMNFCHETLAGYENAVFFDPQNAEQLAVLLKEFLQKGSINPDDTSFSTPAPYASNWQALFEILLTNKSKDS